MVAEHGVIGSTASPAASAPAGSAPLPGRLQQKKPSPPEPEQEPQPPAAATKPAATDADPAAAAREPAPAGPPKQPGGPRVAKPPQGRAPPPSRRPVAHLVAAPQENTTARCAVEAARQSAVNPYGLSDDALRRKQRFDQERAHKNSAVRAVRCLATAVDTVSRRCFHLTPPFGEQEIVLAPLDAVAASTSQRDARSTRVGTPLLSEPLPRTVSDDTDSNRTIVELAAKARWKQLLTGVKVGDAAVVQRLLRDVRDLADAPSPTSVRSLMGRTKAGALEPYGSQRRPLHYAALYKQPKVAKLLLAHGADPNATDKQGWSPLHCAALNGEVVVARVLLAAGAVPSARVFLQGGSDQGETPAAFARRHQQDGVAQVIERHVATTARVLAYQRLAWASAFHDRLGANSCVPSTLGRLSTTATKTLDPPNQCSGTELGTSPTRQALQTVSRSVALGCLVDLAPDSLSLRVARMVPMRRSTGATLWHSAPAHELMLRVWMENNPAWKPSEVALQELPWCD